MSDPPKLPDDNRLRALYQRLRPEDRGWRATILGVGISLFLSVAPV